MNKLDLSNKKLAVNGGKPIRTKMWSDNLTTGQEEKMQFYVQWIRAIYLYSKVRTPRQTILI